MLKKYGKHKKKRVYCINCIHFSFPTEECNHPSNVIYGYTEDDWLSPAEKYIIEHKRKPKKINKNNDCENYEEYPGLI